MLSLLLYPFYLMKYLVSALYVLKSKIFSISYSFLLLLNLIYVLSHVLAGTGSKSNIWQTAYLRILGNKSLKLISESFFIMQNSPSFLQFNLLLGYLVLMFLQSRQTLSPSSKVGPFNLFLFTQVVIYFYTKSSSCQSSLCSFLISVVQSIANWASGSLIGSLYALGLSIQLVQNGNLLVILVSALLQANCAIDNSGTQLSYWQLMQLYRYCFKIWFSHFVYLSV